MKSLPSPALQPSTESSTAPQKCNPEIVRSQMKMLFSAFRLDQYPEPEGFMAQAALVLSNYEEDVVRYVTHPLTGLQARLKFPPTISEITEACSARVKALAQQAELEAWRERKRKSDEIKALGGPRHSAEERAGLMNYGQFLDYCTEHKIKPRPIGRFETVNDVRNARDQDKAELGE